MMEQDIPPDRLFADKQAGRDFERSAYKSLLESIKPGGQLYINPDIS